ncbi:MAG: glycosyltransferase family 2 protein [Paludibacteraceae bacterium]
MTQPRISILLPAYNAARYLREAVESMLMQTYRDFELLLLNDGSTDSTEQIALELANSDERIRYIRNPHNVGLANTLNRGLSLAQGEFIARMDADDISLPTRLETQVRYLDAHPDVMLCSCAIQQFGASDKLMVGREEFEQVKVDMLFASAIGHASSVWRRAFFENNNLFFNQDEFPAEDYGLWTRAVFYGKLVNIPDVLYRYRIYPEQVTATDPRVTEKCMQIRRNYILRLCPSMQENYIQAFLAVDHGIANYAYWRDCVAFVRSMCKHTTDIARPCLRRVLLGYIARRAKLDAHTLPNIYQRTMVRWGGYYFRIVKYLNFIS